MYDEVGLVSRHLFQYLKNNIRSGLGMRLSLGFREKGGGGGEELYYTS